MKKLYILIALLIVSITSFSQTDFVWAVQNDATTGAEGKSLVTDALGNTYVLGTTGGWPDVAVSFSGNVLTKFGGQDIVLVKFDTDGNYVWGKTFGSNGSDQGISIALDHAGNLVICGTYSGTINFGSQSVTSTGSSNNVYVAKFNADGDNLWAFSTSGNGMKNVNSIAIDSDNGIYLTGYYFNNAQLFGYNPSGKGAYLVKLNANGAALTLKTITSTGSFVNEGKDIAIDNAGNLLWTGNFNDTSDAEGTSLTSLGQQDIYLFKYNSSGNYLWHKTYGGTSADSPTSITIDATNKIFLTGAYRNSADFGSVTLTAADAWYDDIFVAAMDVNGDVLWAKNTNMTYNFAYSIHAASDDLIYVGGKLSADTQIDGVTLPGGMSLLTFNKTTGAFQSTLSAEVVSGGIWSDQVSGISEDVSGNIYVTGKFSGSKKLGETTVSHEYDGLFLAKAGNATSNTCVVKADFSAVNAQVGAMVTFTDASLNTTENTTYSWDVDGDETPDYTTIGNISHTYTEAGTYNVKLILEDGSCIDEKIVEIVIYPLPDASFTYVIDKNAVTFTATGTTNTTWSWDFGDASEASDIQNPMYQFAQKGTYNVCLTTSNEGGSTTECKEITVSNPPYHAWYDIHENTSTSFEGDFIRFFNENNGLLASGSNYYKTFDGGVTLELVNKPVQLISALTFYDEAMMHGYAAGYTSSTAFLNGEISTFRTTDGGENWTSIEVINFSATYAPTAFGAFGRLYFTDSNTAYGYGNTLRLSDDDVVSLMSITADGGNTWNFHVISEATVYDLVMFDPGNGIATAGNKIVKTTDGGASWSQIYAETYPLRDIEVVSEDIMYIARSNSLGLLKTTDGGTSWSAVPGSARNMGKISFLNEQKGIASVDARIQRTEDGGHTWVTDTISRHVLTNHGTWGTFGIFNLKYISDSVAYGSTIKYLIKSMIGDESQIPDPDFSYIINGNMVNFTDESTNSPLFREWNFDHPHPQYIQDPTHAYAAAGEYNVCLTASNNHGSATKCMSISVSEIPNSLINIEGEELDNFKTYPNPFNDRLNIEFKSLENTHARIDIFDMTGRKVKTLLNQQISEGNHYQVEFRPESEASGFYMCQITLKSKVYHIKLIRK